MLRTVPALAGPALDAAATDVADFIDRVLSAAHATTADTMATVDLSVSQLRMLFVLLRGAEPLPVNEVADGVGLSLPTAGRAADRLVALGLVDRREDDHDRRVKRLSLTGAGHELLAEHFCLHADDLRGVLATLPGEVAGRLHTAVAEASSYLPPRPGPKPGRH